MDIRAQVSMVFHLDKCIGCHTCSIACKNVWTDRKGAEYMWWNNVETKPGTGYPQRWEDQEHYKGGWRIDPKNRLKLKSQSRGGGLMKLFYNPNQPGLEDYYEPWTYDYQNLFNAPEGDDQPTARAVSQITGQPMNIESGPNWDDDLSGSPIYAENDLNLDSLSQEEREQMFEIERVAMMYLPRICNHCANPSCVASCPSGALYKRGEDGIVLINQDVCRGWRACVSACPYKKIYYNWQTGKSEKCILCFPRLETGQPPACFHSCVGRIRYLGVLLYDADLLDEVMKAPNEMLVESQRRMICDPNDPSIRAAALKNGISEEMVHSAAKSPVYRLVKEWGIALPLHIEYRTNPMLFYVPPLLPVMGKSGSGAYEHDTKFLFDSIDSMRVPIKFLASLFSAGNTEIVSGALRKLLAVRIAQRTKDMKDTTESELNRILREADLTPEAADAIYELSAIPTVRERYVMPPLQREEAISSTCSTEECKGECGFGVAEKVSRKI